MKKKKYILLGIVALLCSIVFLSFIPKKDTYAQTFDYEAQVQSDLTFLPDYAISSIESVSCESYYGVEFYFNTSNVWSDVCYIASTSAFNFPEKVSQIAFSIDTNSSEYSKYGTDCFSIILTSLSSDGYFSSYFFSDTFFILNCWGPFKIGLYNTSLDFYSANIITPFVYPLSWSGENDNFSLMNDMDSSTSFPITGPSNTYNGNYTVWNSLLNSLKTGDFSFLKTFEIRDIDYCGFVTDDGIQLYNYFFYSVRDFLFDDNYLKGRLDYYDYGFFVENLTFNIYRPVQTIRNTLIIYCYDYIDCFLDNCQSLVYSLRRGQDRYNIRWSGDGFNNSYYTLYYCDELANTQFDEYIDLSFGASGYIKSYYLDGDTSENSNYCIKLGFDFNFVYYTEPFVASNGTYNYDFQKPSYVYMPFSLIPLYIPLLEFVENAMIFLMFYCPIVSDIMSILYLDRFLGAVLSVVHFVLGSGIGQFVTSCIAFFMFFALIKTFMPIIYNAGADAIGSVRGMYHKGYRYKQEKKQAKREMKYQKYKSKRMSKQNNILLRKQSIKNNGRKYTRMVDKTNKILRKSSSYKGEKIDY